MIKPKKPPTLAEVNAAWDNVRLPTGTAARVRHDPFLARPYYQGIVEEHLLQQASLRRGSTFYRKPTVAELRAIKTIRAWLEFGDAHDPMMRPRTFHDEWRGHPSVAEVDAHHEAHARGETSWWVAVYPSDADTMWAQPFIFYARADAKLWMLNGRCSVTPDARWSPRDYRLTPVPWPEVT